MVDDDSWQKQLADVLSSDLEIARRLKEKVPSGTIADWLNRREKGVDSISKGHRISLYKVTGLDVFYFDGYVDPDTISLRDIVNGSESAQHLEIWMGYNRVSYRTLSEEAGVDRKSTVRFTSGKDVVESTKKKLLGVLEKYADQYEGMAKTRRVGDGTESVGRVDVTRVSEDDRLVEIAKNVLQLSDQVKALGVSYDLCYEERKSILDSAVDTMVEQMDYFREAPQKERESLARYLRDRNQFTRWGWLNNVLGGISNKEGTPATFAREMEPPEKENNRRKS